MTREWTRQNSYQMEEKRNGEKITSEDEILYILINMRQEALWRMV
jgi:hypothetical protein